MLLRLAVRRLPKTVPVPRRGSGVGAAGRLGAQAPFLARPPQRLPLPISGMGLRGAISPHPPCGPLILHQPIGRRLTRRRDIPYRPRARSAVTILSRLTAADGRGLRRHTHTQHRAPSVAGSAAAPASTHPGAVLAVVFTAAALAAGVSAAVALAAVAGPTAAALGVAAMVAVLAAVGIVERSRAMGTGIETPPDLLTSRPQRWVGVVLTGIPAMVRQAVVARG